MTSDTYAQRSSHRDFFELRDWNNVSLFWRESLEPNNYSDLFQQNHNIKKSTRVDDQVNDDNDKFDGDDHNNDENYTENEMIYDVTNLKEIHRLGLQEYQCGDPRYKRQTFAMRIGYDGTQYHGYQRQLINKNSNIKVYDDADSDDDDDPSIKNINTGGVKNLHSNTDIPSPFPDSINNVIIPTVEEDIYTGLGGRSCIAAGRTDKGVHAISQIISFSTYDAVTPESLTLQLRNSPACRQGHLSVFECVRVPKRFNALFSATWRRYLFLFPLNAGVFPYTLPYNDGNENHDDNSGDNSNENVNYSNHDIINDNNTNINSANNSNKSPQSNGRNMDGVDVNVEFVHTALQQLVGKALPYNAYAYREDRSRHKGDICTLFKARAFVMPVPTTASSSSSSSSLPLAMCVELVGDRFLRRMVRILVATAVRESITATPQSIHLSESTPPQDANSSIIGASDDDNGHHETAHMLTSSDPPSSNVMNNHIHILSDIAMDGQRCRASVAVDGRGLCLGGVGYDLTDLAINKISGKRSKKKADCSFASS